MQCDLIRQLWDTIGHWGQYCHRNRLCAVSVSKCLPEWWKEGIWGYRKSAAILERTKIVSDVSKTCLGKGLGAPISCERSHCADKFQLSRIRPTKSPPAGDIGCGRTYRNRVYCRTDADSTEPLLPLAPPSLGRPIMLALRRESCHTSTPLHLFV